MIVGMRYLVFSDLHGSKLGLERLKAAVKAEKPDVLLCLGDTLYGAMDQDSSACAAYLSSPELSVVGVRGNCDYDFDESALGFALPEEQTLYFSGRRLILRHAPFWRDFGPKDVALYGHTHIKSLDRHGGTILCNPGSIGKPRDGFPSYALIDEAGVTLVEASTRTRLTHIDF